jgi:hypothetical protein
MHMGYSINDTDSRYNGWTNYATWRVNLEIFDGFDAREYFTDANDEFDASELAANLEAYADERISEDSGRDSLAVAYARAFMADVNWQEIAEHLLDAIKSEAA